MSVPVDLDSFLSRLHRANVDPVRTATAARSLIDGALRIRGGVHGVYGDVPRPVTKPAEAIGAWIGEISRHPNMHSRRAELREALVAAAEEVNAAARTVPQATRLQGALYSDALDSLGTVQSVPWWMVALSGILGGLLIGVLLTRRR